MTHHEAKQSAPYEQFPEIKNISEKSILTTIKTDPKCPIQDLMCREEHRELFEGLWNKNQNR